jgi:hypothetical protein
LIYKASLDDLYADLTHELAKKIVNKNSIL